MSSKSAPPGARYFAFLCGRLMKKVLLLLQEKREPSKRYRRASGRLTLALLFRAQVGRFHSRWSPSSGSSACWPTRTCTRIPAGTARPSLEVAPDSHPLACRFGWHAVDERTPTDGRAASERAG